MEDVKQEWVAPKLEELSFTSTESGAPGPFETTSLAGS